MLQTGTITTHPKRHASFSSGRWSNIGSARRHVMSAITYFAVHRGGITNRVTLSLATAGRCSLLVDGFEDDILCSLFFEEAAVKEEYFLSVRGDEEGLLSFTLLEEADAEECETFLF